MSLTHRGTSNSSQDVESIVSKTFAWVGHETMCESLESLLTSVMHASQEEIGILIDNDWSTPDMLCELGMASNTKIVSLLKEHRFQHHSAVKAILKARIIGTYIVNEVPPIPGKELDPSNLTMLEYLHHLRDLELQSEFFSSFNHRLLCKYGRINKESFKRELQQEKGYHARRGLAHGERLSKMSTSLTPSPTGKESLVPMAHPSVPKASVKGTTRKAVEPAPSSASTMVLRTDRYIPKKSLKVDIDSKELLREEVIIKNASSCNIRPTTGIHSTDSLKHQKSKPLTRLTRKDDQNQGSITRTIPELHNESEDTNTGETGEVSCPTLEPPPWPRSGLSTAYEAPQPHVPADSMIDHGGILSQGEPQVNLFNNKRIKFQSNPHDKDVLATMLQEEQVKTLQAYSSGEVQWRGTNNGMRDTYASEWKDTPEETPRDSSERPWMFESIHRGSKIQGIGYPNGITGRILKEIKRKKLSPYFIFKPRKKKKEITPRVWCSEISLHKENQGTGYPIFQRQRCKAWKGLFPDAMFDIYPRMFAVKGEESYNEISN